MLMESENFKYYAFISYSHKDKKIARKLQKRLQSYHLPSKLMQSHPDLPKKLSPVFIDEANLVAKEESLTEAIREYLDASNYLILICSPDSAKSPYVNDEVEYFIKLGRRNHIIPLIAGGLPRSKDTDSECFPPEILKLPRELEPLGIDIKTFGERDSFLRVIATMLGLDLEYFISAETRERKRRLAIYSSMAAVFAVIAGIFVWYNIDFFHAMMYSADAQYNLGEMYYYGRGVEKDYGKAIEWYERAAAKGHIGAKNNLAERCYEAGKNYYFGKEIAKDYDKAVEWYEKAADKGHSLAKKELGKWCYLIGAEYYYGNEVERDYHKAIELYQKASDNGYAEAQKNLGLIYYYGWGNVQQDHHKAAEYYRKAADNGNIDAQYHLGGMYENGEGVEKDYDKAMELYQNAANKGSIIAQHYLGIVYYRAKCGVEKDYIKAAEWYQKAADKGSTASMKALAEMYEKGLGVEKNPAKAKELYDKAAAKRK